MGLFDKLKTDTPNLDRHLEALEAAPNNDLKPGQLAEMLKQAATRKDDLMDPITIANLVIMGLGLITDLIKAVKQGESGQPADDAVFSHAGDFLAKVGTVAKVKELTPEAIQSFMPAIKDLISKVHELRLLNKD